MEWTRTVTTAAAVRAGKVPVLWQSTGAGPDDPAWNPATAGLPNATVFMAWLDAASVAAYARRGARVVATSDFYVAGMGSGGWASVYGAEIMPPNLTADEAARVLGGQICIWGETMASANLAVRAWQIGAGAAENFWGRPEPPPEVNSWALQDRFNRFLCHLRNYGITAPPQMPGYCGYSA